MSWAVRAFERADTESVVALWTEAGLTRPWNDPRLDIERKLRVQPELFLVAEDTSGDVDGTAIVGTVMAGYDGHRGWIYYLASAESHRHRGIARALVREAERLLEAMGCPKVQLMVREGNDGVLAFYDALDYERFSVTNLGKRLIDDV
ncbi:GNAT family acetyltransferase [Microbacterium foliorum]|uniref:GNAT family acetyltransferase n=1 Tax=Microbacterium foliorum TaxID=104336 RepID=UPI001E164C91|nr:GNAT family acetyltransferase [Microbacterium foliorum]CAH0126836.1 Acetyltransferase YpeA [Microbacterium foliorum]CAH0127227.1 Acetyltransferase YpeA [Microbacterium foliorum]